MSRTSQITHLKDVDIKSGFSIGGTAVTATAAELNQLAGATATAAQTTTLAAAAGTVTFDRLVKVAKVALGNSADTGGAILAWQNPESSTIFIERFMVNTTTKATSACTADFGTTATNATTSSDNLIDGVDLGTAAGLFDNITDKGSNGKSKQSLAAGKWITGSTASGAVAGLVGFAYIHYVLS